MGRSYVQLHEGGYKAALAAVADWASTLPAEEAAAIMGGTAARLFHFV